MSDPVYSSNSYVTLRKAAIAGRGVALLPIRLVGDELATAPWSPCFPDVRGAGPAAVRAALPRHPDDGAGPALPRLRVRLVPQAGPGQQARPAVVKAAQVKSA